MRHMLPSGICPHPRGDFSGASVENTGYHLWVSRVEYPILVTNEFLEIFTGQKVHFLKFQLQQKRQKSDTYALSY